jgi:hypothetical protein
MNEKIKELAEQAMWHTNSKTDEVYRTHFQFEERFAMLIIRECMSLFPYKSFKNEYDQDISGADIIKKHFGVEE